MPEVRFKTKGYVFPVDVAIRIRVQLEIDASGTQRFAVSLEHEWEPDDWRRVASWDNWGGRMHRDLYRPDGSDERHHEVRFHSDDVNQCVAWAKTELITHARRYVSQFRDQST
jgi:hypothetical protein